MFALEALVSGALYIISALVVGTLAAASFMLPPDETPLRKTLLSSAIVLIAIFLLAAVVALAVQGAKLSGGALPTGDILLRYIARTQSGRIWLDRELYGALLLIIVFAFAKT